MNYVITLEPVFCNVCLKKSSKLVTGFWNRGLLNNIKLILGDQGVKLTIPIFLAFLDSTHPSYQHE